MKATEIIKQYNLKYDTASGRYKRESKNKNDVIYELIEVNEDNCLFFSEYPLLGGDRSVYAVENDLPVLEHWVRDEKDNFHCSRCGAEACFLPHGEKAYITLTPYCHNCGAKMKVEYEDDDIDNKERVR